MLTQIYVTIFQSWVLFTKNTLWLMISGHSLMLAVATIVWFGGDQLLSWHNDMLDYVT